MRPVLLFMAMLGVAAATVTFRIGTLYDGFTINKFGDLEEHGGEGEDSRATTTFSLAMADGVTETKTSSRPLADILVFETCLYHNYLVSDPRVKHLGLEDYRVGLLKQINSRLKQFWVDINAAYNEVLATFKAVMDPSEMKSRLPLNTFGTASTLVAALLNPYTQHNNLKVFQKGDSLVLIFRPVLDPATKSYAYTLAFASPPQKIGGAPSQFVGIDAKKNLEDDAVFEWTVLPGDIVLLGSDGLFDNVHFGVLAFCVNFFAKQLITDRIYHLIPAKLGKIPPLPAEQLFAKVGKSLAKKFVEEGDSVVAAVKSDYSPLTRTELEEGIRTGRLKVVSPHEVPKEEEQRENLADSHEGRANVPNLSRGIKPVTGRPNSQSKPDKDLPYQMGSLDFEVGKDRVEAKEWRPEEHSFTRKDNPFTRAFVGNPDNVFRKDSSPSLLSFKFDQSADISWDESEIPLQRQDSRLGKSGFTHFFPPEKDLEPSLPIFDDDANFADEIEALIRNVPSRDLAWRRFGERTDEKPLISGRLEMFLAKKFRFGPFLDSRFIKTFNSQYFGKALTHLAHFFSEQSDFYPSPIGLEILKEDGDDSYLVGKIDDITALPALVVPMGSFTALDRRESDKKFIKFQDAATAIIKGDVMVQAMKVAGLKESPRSNSQGRVLI